ncbi:hypothetical protein FH972_024030 [Carpinus fangiana]|uniref:Uncharacterized protein n=1 Tax=Carpinus fangiana TaxID=176857 RepID=A0A5N6KXC6_9ROSI|nr:hypothetical protein FH972_024030 [Carpinus fangiana]
MSKRLKDFLGTPDFATNLLKELLRTLTPEQRVLPKKYSKDDKDADLRIDAGEKIGDNQNVVLQVNSGAKSEVLQKKQPHKYHSKLATGSFNTKAEDKEAEIQKLIDQLKDEAEDKLG